MFGVKDSMWAKADLKLQSLKQGLPSLQLRFVSRNAALSDYQELFLLHQLSKAEQDSGGLML